MGNRTYRVGLVGLRGIASRGISEPLKPFREEIVHSHAAGLSVSSQFDIVGVCDLVPELLESFGETWDHRFPNATKYSDFEQMLRESDIDILGIATGDHTHATLGTLAVAAGVKGIFCEKPLATTIEDADRLIEACESNNVVIAVDHTRRYQPGWLEVREEIRGGAIGNLTTIVGTLGGPRAMMFRNGTHMIDTICMYAESKPVQVWAKLQDGFDDWDRYKGDGGKLPENDPGAMGFIQFENGTQALYCGMKNTHGMFSLQLSGPDGQIYVTADNATVTTSSTLEQSREVNGSRRRISAGTYKAEGIAAAYEEIVDLIENGGEGVSMAREARKTVQILMGFLASNQANSKLIDLVD